MTEKQATFTNLITFLVSQKQMNEKINDLETICIHNS